MTFSSRRLKFCVRRPIVNGIGAAAEHDDPSWPRYVRITDIAGPRKLRDETFMSLPPEQAEQAPFDVGDILAAAVGATFGKTYLHLRDIGPAAFAGYLVRISPNDEFDAGFVAYWTESQHYWDQVNTSVVQSTIQNFSAAKYAELRLPSPSLLLQRAIVRFLDHETARVDALIAAKQRVLDLLAEKRKAIIATAVTRGLDPNVKLRDSGVPWLGEIPAHWHLKRMKYLFRLVADKAPVDNNFELLSLYTDVGVKPRRELEERGNKASSTDEYWMVQPGDLVVNKLLAWMGAFGVSEYRGVTSPAYDILRPYDGVESLFYHHLFRCGVATTEVRARSYGIMDMRLRLYFDRLGDMYVPFPRLDEQRAVVEHIARGTTKLDALRAATERTIALLKERRSALIAAAVTGQLDVGASA